MVRLEAAIIPAAGQGKRMAGYTTEIPKPMIRINGTPILKYTILRAKRMGVRMVYLVVNPKGSVIREYFQDGAALGVEIIYLVQETPRGIGHAVQLGEDYITGRFAVLLGDEIYIQSNHEQMLSVFDESTNAVIGLMHSVDKDMIRRNYTVRLSTDRRRILDLKEKPEVVDTDILGVGTYLFDPLVFKAIRNTPPGHKQEVEITDSIRSLCQLDAVVRPFFLEGHYLNVTYPQDIESASRMIQDDPAQRGI